jgi:hypothetical protein
MTGLTIDRNGSSVISLLTRCWVLWVCLYCIGHCPEDTVEQRLPRRHGGEFKHEGYRILDMEDTIQVNLKLTGDVFEVWL